MSVLQKNSESDFADSADFRPEPSAIALPGVDRAIALALAWVVLGIVAVALAGWVFNDELLKTIWPGGAELKPNTALGLVASAISLIFAAGPSNDRAWRLALSLAVSAFGLIFLLEYASGVDFGVDDAIFHGMTANLPGRPSIPTSVSFVIVGLALALTPMTAAFLQFLRNALALGGIALASTGALGYFVPTIDASVHRLWFGFAINTAVAFLGLFIGVLAAGRRREGSNEFVSLAAPILGLLALAALIVVSLFAVDTQYRVRARAQSAEAVEKSLMRLLGLVRDAESGQRGYLLTGLESFLEPYRAASPEIVESFATIGKQIGDDAAARERLEGIRALAQAKMQELERTISLKKAGDAAGAMALLEGGEGLRGMAELRQGIAGMRDDLQARVNKGRAEANAQLTRLQFSTLLSVSLVMALAIFAFFDGRRRFEHLRWIQRELAFSNANLDRGIKAKTSALSAALEAARRAEDNVRELNSHLEEQVSARSRELERIFHLSSDILGVGDFDGQLVRISPAYEAVTGRKASDALALPVIEMIHPGDWAGVEAEFEKVFDGRPVDFVARSLRADGGLCWLSWRIVSVIGERLFYFVVRDITEERHREDVVRQAQKMEAVGQLTGGIAHDFNNLLTIVIGNLDSLRRGLIEASPRARRQIDHALIGAQKAAALTGRLLAFSRRQPLAPAVVDANGLVSGMSEILHRTLGETIAVQTVLAAGLWRTQVDPNQLENAILNLAINARDAMASGGKLTIETANAHLDETYVSANPEAAAGQYVQVAVTDTGEGMSPEVARRAFEPFFTTKPAGIGTGLGLSQVYGFLKQSGGHIAIYSEASVGTAIKLYLPRCLATPQIEGAARKPAPVEARANGETVLVVEDEDGVRAFVVEALEDAGYQVYAAADGATALEVLKAHSSIDLMVSDVVLGGALNGRELRDEAMKFRPGLPVLYITGYTRNAILHNGRLDEGVSLLTKPFTASDLLSKMRKMLDARDVDQLKLL